MSREGAFCCTFPAKRTSLTDATSSGPVAGQLTPLGLPRGLPFSVPPGPSNGLNLIYLECDEPLCRPAENWPLWESTGT